MLRNLFNITKRADPVPAKNPPTADPMADPAAMPEDMPESEDTVDEAEIEAVVARLTEAVAAGIRGCVTDMAKEKKAAGKKPAPDTTPESTEPGQGTAMDDEQQEMALSALLAADYLLADLQIEAALKEGR